MNIQYSPKHKDTAVLLRAKINNERSRFLSCLNKIERLFYLSSKGNVGAILELHDWNASIHKTDIYFSREIERLEKKIKIKIKGQLTSTHCPNPSFRIPIKNRPQAQFFVLLQKWDELLFLLQCCWDFSIFKSHRGFAWQRSRYRKEIHKIINTMSQHRLVQKKRAVNLTPKEGKRLSMALRSPLMPQSKNKGEVDAQKL